jgi:tRNA pseudouridine55 synthase
VLSGILLLDKPLGLSSNAALQRVKRAFGASKAGHVGSLDPLATGMLPICLGEATKVAGDILSGRKGYRFTLRLGERTATGDAEGEVIERAALPALDAQRIERALAGFCGPQSQVPPMYSAIKQAGQPLYKLARAGIEVARAARDIEILAFSLRGFDARSLELEVICSKGTYVRTLAEDLARRLGSCGHLVQLRRQFVEPFADQPMWELGAMEAAGLAGRLPPLIPPGDALAGLPAVTLDLAQLARVRHGHAVDAPGLPAAPRVRLYGPQAQFLGIGECDGRGRVQPRRLLAEPPSSLVSTGVSE